jgi:hypothetical protein
MIRRGPIDARTPWILEAVEEMRKIEMPKFLDIVGVEPEQMPNIGVTRHTHEIIIGRVQDARKMARDMGYQI